MLWALALVTPDALARDRLEQFQEIVGRASGSTVERLAPALYALVDEEILENMTSGGVFASEAFIQERLDGFSGTWGGAHFRVRRLPGPTPSGPARGETTIALYSMEGLEGSGSVRVFGSGGDGAVLLRSLTHEGTPEVHEWPPAAGGSLQFAVSWVGGALGRGGRMLRVEVWRRRAAGISRVWSTAVDAPDGLVASDVRITRGEIALRYEARYPGWKPGCEGQTEHEDLYRVGPSGDGVRLVRRRVVNGWHRELWQTVTRFFDALDRRDSRVLAELVPDASVRARIPRALVPEPACEGRPQESPATAIIAATEEGERRRTPWSLWWRQIPGGWRLSGAAPVLE